MSYGLLLIRLVFGLTLATHGSQKLFGWFGGPGPRGTAAFFGQLGFRAPLAMALAAGATELGGGLLFALGLVTPLAALALVVVMLIAIATVHAAKGFFAGGGGFEYNLAILTAAVAIPAIGPGRFAIDHVLGIAGSLSGLWWGVAVLAAAALASSLTLALGRKRVIPVGQTA
ncbi:MAG: DoxX family protein [Gaiellaceae bacterium]